MKNLKQTLIAEIEAKKDEISAIADFLLKNPETGYKEFKTSAFVRNELEKLGLQVKTDLAITGLRADIDSGRPGPKIAIMGELDALPVPSHPFADQQTGAAHACGHFAQLTMMLAAAKVLVPVIKELSGSIAFIAVPAEEFQSLEYCRKLIADGKISYCGGKPEFIKQGVFDDIDMVLLIHAGHDTFTPASFNGFCMKQIIFKGRAAHGGLSPWAGINAATMARQALNMIDGQRDTFNDKDSVRIHGIISDGGNAVNVVPARAELELQVRAKTPEAVKSACSVVDRCVKAAAMAFGGSVEIHNLGGYMPYQGCPELNAVHAENLKELCGGVLGDFGHRGSSTDMGDVSMLIPALHAYSGGFSGSPHAKDFVMVDFELACIQGAKLLAMDAVSLLGSNAEKAKAIASLPKIMDKKTYFEYKELLSSSEEFDYDQA
ncbi:MAG: amidohydrolase [Lentisphaeria bacterium]|nr:amidohydrolase [Lentisphaeria bacterium]